MICRIAPEDLEDWFPGRWDRRRAIHDGARLLVAAVAGALAQADCWQPGSGAEIAGGLVVATDLVSRDPAARFASAIETDSLRSPTDFLFALPSSAAAVVGLAVGLLDYQATICDREQAGAAALRHALDLVAHKRLERVVVAAHSAGIAVAYCLDQRHAAPLLRELQPVSEAPGAATSLLDAYEALGYE